MTASALNTPANLHALQFWQDLQYISTMFAEPGGLRQYGRRFRARTVWQRSSRHDDYRFVGYRRWPFTITHFLEIAPDGGYAEYMVPPQEALALIPKELSSIDAAPLLCAGNTTFNALRHSGAKPGDMVAIQGVGGLGHLALQYSNKFGYKTFALSRGEDKRELALQLGAHVYIDTAVADAGKELQKLGGAARSTQPNLNTYAEAWKLMVFLLMCSGLMHLVLQA